MSRIKSLKDAVQQAVNNGARSAEEVYLRISRMPFDQLERIAALEGIVGRARGMHDQSVARITEVILKLNKRIGKLADQALKRLGLVPPPAHKARRKKR
jgi:hypothetical protein